MSTYRDFVQIDNLWWAISFVRMSDSKPSIPQRLWMYDYLFACLSFSFIPLNWALWILSKNCYVFNFFKGLLVQKTDWQRTKSSLYYETLKMQHHWPSTMTHCTWKSHQLFCGCHIFISVSCYHGDWAQHFRDVWFPLWLEYKQNLQWNTSRRQCK